LSRSQFAQYGHARSNRRLGLEPPSVGRADTVEEGVDRGVIPDMWIGQGFDGMLKFVSDCRNQFVAISTSVHNDPQNAMGTRHLHRERETCPHMMAARRSAILDDQAVQHRLFVGTSRSHCCPALGSRIKIARTCEVAWR
jgi:hypothetical protein